MHSVSSRFRRGTCRALLPALGLLVLAGCGDEQTPAGATSPSVSSPAPTTTTPSVVTEPTTPSSPSNTTDPSGEQADVTLDVTIAQGKVSPSGGTVRVAVGKTIRITGVTDAADEIHVHGYDKTIELKPGKPGSITFKADRKGSFEVESHETGKLIAKLVVS